MRHLLQVLQVLELVPEPQGLVPELELPQGPELQVLPHRRQLLQLLQCKQYR